MANRVWKKGTGMMDKLSESFKKKIKMEKGEGKNPLAFLMN